MRKVWMFAGALAVAAAVYWLRPGQEPVAPTVADAANPTAAPDAVAKPASPARLAASAVLSIDPRTKGSIPLPPPRATLFNEYLVARNYRALYERLNGSPEAETAQGKLVMYEILRQCATVTGGMRPGYRQVHPNREEFMANLAPTDPQREKRLAAFEAFTQDKCAGVEGLSISRADLLKMLNDAASLGDPGAKALALEQELWQQRRAGGGDGRWNRDGGVTLTDAQVQSIKDMVATRDPEAIRAAGRVLANSWNDYALRVGPDQQPVEPRAFMNAWLVLACEYGAPCGSDSPRMLQACAMQGHCDAMNYPDYIYYYGMSPHDSQLLTQYRQILRNGIETGNWSQLAVVRGQPPGGNRITFVPGPR
jgi:hypothetical protein